MWPCWRRRGRHWGHCSSLLQTRMDVLSPCSNACLPPYSLSEWTGTHPLSCVNSCLFCSLWKYLGRATRLLLMGFSHCLNTLNKPVWQSLFTPNATPPPSPNTALHLREKASQQLNSSSGKPEKISQMSSSCHQHHPSNRTRPWPLSSFSLFPTLFCLA